MDKNGNVKPEISCKIRPCTSEYGEGGPTDRDSGKISWQHFPRSTSTIGSCDLGSKEKLGFSPSETSTAIYKDEKSPTGTPTSVSSGPVVKTMSELKAEHYLRIRSVFEFFNFLIGHLISSEPEDPVRFLTELVDKCISARNGEADPPLLFSEEHVKAVYGAFDPFGRGSIKLTQYQEAMRTLGLRNGTTRYGPSPSLDDKGHVKETFFLSEANGRLLENFKKMTRIPKKWEENRRTYSRKMTERPDFDFPETGGGEEGSDGEGSFSECTASENEGGETICFSIPRKTPVQETKLKHEPEQLFLTVGRDRKS